MTTRDAPRSALAAFLRSLETMTYYAILGVANGASGAEIKAAFHAFSLRYHPDRYVGSHKEIGALASEIYKRGVEAYGCLSRRPQRERYDRALGRGKLRLEPSRPSTVPPPAPVRTLEAVATTDRGKAHAIKADRLITAGRLDDARVALVSACQCEPNNAELEERLQILWEVLALDPS